MVGSFVKNRESFHGTYDKSYYCKRECYSKHFRSSGVWGENCTSAGLWFDIADTHKYPQFNYLSDSVISFLLQESKDAQIIYIETDYFGGYGTQTGVLFENGSIAIEPMQGNGVINYLLHQIGVYKEHNKDEFTSLQLYRFRRMD